MTQRNNILQELKELNSTLVNISTENIYSVPAGYFDGLAARMIARIKAINAANAVEELNYLAPSLNDLSKQNPYTVPVGYFESLAEKAMQSIHKSNDHQTAKEEIESLSPLLSGLKKQMPYSVPQGYFESITEKPVKTETKIVSFTKQTWFRYAAAAVVIGIIALVGINRFVKDTISIDPIVGVQKDIKKMSDDDLKNFIQYTDAGLTGEEKASTNNNTDEIKELLKDIPESELKEFIEETADTDTETSMMN